MFFCSTLMLEPGIINVVSASEVHFQLFLLLPPSHMTTHSVVSEPRLLVATHLYLPESAGIEFMISIVMTPSVCVIGYLSVSSSFPPLNHLICERQQVGNLELNPRKKIL